MADPPPALSLDSRVEERGTGSMYQESENLSKVPSGFLLIFQSNLSYMV